VLTAQASMALFPDVPDAGARAVVWPLQKAHQAWWWFRRGRGTEIRRVRETTGAFAFVARKPVAPNIEGAPMSGGDGPRPENVRLTPRLRSDSAP
jgi:hypothetical protein